MKLGPFSHGVLQNYILGYNTQPSPMFIWRDAKGHTHEYNYMKYNEIYMNFQNKYFDGVVPVYE